MTIDPSVLPKPFVSSRPDWIELHDFAWRTAAKNVRECRGHRYMDCAWDPTRNYQWVWDTCFMALYGRYGNGMFPAVSSLDNFYRLQRDDGFIAMTYDLDTGDAVYGERINPPLFAWVEWEHYRVTGDATRFSDVIPKITNLMDWIERNRRSAPRKVRHPLRDVPVFETTGKKDVTGTSYPFYHFEDCGSCGMDDSPRTPREPDAGQYFDWIDLSAQMALSFRMLARMNRVLGELETASSWDRRADELSAAINRELWCEETRFYHDRSAAPNFVSCKTIAGFWPILAEVAKGDRIDSLAAHLRDERTFNRPLPIPTLAADDCNYCGYGTYWLGGVWAPTNYMVVRGLAVAGQGDLAHEIAVKYLNGLSEVYRNVEPHTLWECYAPDVPRPGLNPYDRQFVKPHFVGWTGIGPIAMLIENVLGIEVDVPSRRIDWNIRLNEPHGIRDLGFGNEKIHLECDFDSLGRAHVRIESDQDIDLRIVRNGETKECCSKGNCSIRFG